jgi:mannose-1-phosphate guanylyltransferase
LTSDAAGVAVPKQFCTLLGARSLVQEAVRLARRVVAADRIVVAVAAGHEPLWKRQLASLPRENVVVQPRNRGSGTGLLLALTSVLRRDPDAVIAMLPADQFVRREDVLVASLRRALDAAAHGEIEAGLLGMVPDAPVCDYGWILPGAELGGRSGFHRVRKFVEKPPLAEAGRLLAGGGLWNAFLVAGRARDLADMIDRVEGRSLSAQMRAAAVRGYDALERFYEVVPQIDFSYDVLQEEAQRLAVVAVPPCGWTDLGTPDRVASCLQSLAPTELVRAWCRPHVPAVNLARRLHESVVTRTA